MEILKKTSDRSYKENSRMMLKNPSVGLHFNTYDNIAKVKEELDHYKSTNEKILYDAKIDTTFSADCIAYYTRQILERFPNFILSLDDPELALFVKEILKLENRNLLVATDLSKSEDGDFLICRDRFITRKRIERLKNIKKLILDQEALGLNDTFQILEQSEDSIVSSWNLKLLK